MADEILDAAEKAAKNAKRAALLAVLAVIVAAGVLALDNSIKNAILTEAGKARKILDEFKEVANGAQAAQQNRTASGDRVDGGDDLVHGAGAPAETGADAGNGSSPARDRAGRFSARARGDG